MHNQQRSEFDAFNRVLGFNEKNKIELYTITEYSPEKEKFEQAVLAIKNAGIAQLQKGVDGDATLAVKKIMSNVIIKYCLRAGVIARSSQNALLAKQ